VELPHTLRLLQAGNIAPVDLAQAAIGPGMAVFTRYSKVVDAEGKPLSVRVVLEIINQTLDEVLAEQEGDFDSDSRWAVAWFEQHGFHEGEYGVAETLSKAKNTSVAGLVEAGILASKGGAVRLLKPDELPENWDPTTDARLTGWEMVHHLVRVLEANGESAAAELAARLGAKAEVARELCYRLYTLCERKKRASEALLYNSLVRSWPEIARLARDKHEHEYEAEQTSLFANEDEIRSLYQANSFDDALRHVRGHCEIAALTRSEKGSVIVSGDEIHVIDPEPVASVVDTTGAGDLYAAGFLFGLSRGLDLFTCGRLGSIAASEAISHMGARPETSLAELAKRKLGEIA